ncbi:MAG: hypothetical protein U0670_22610 [Anaerolineae bacterium]
MPPKLPFVPGGEWIFHPHYQHHSEIIDRTDRGVYMTMSVLTFQSVDRQYIALSYVDGVTYILNQDGTEIWVQASPKLSMGYIMDYLLSTVASFLLHLRHRIALHASGIVIGDEAVLFVGNSGMGKSTLAASYALRGHEVVTDDIAGIYRQGSDYFVAPGFPFLRLWQTSTSALLGVEESLPTLAPDWHKQFLDLQGSDYHFAQDLVKLGRIYVLHSRSDKPTAQRMNYASAISALMSFNFLSNIFKKSLYAADFHAISTLIKSVPVFELTVPDMIEQLGSLDPILMAVCP